MSAQNPAPTASAESDPKLAPPGAGLPKLELWIGRIQFRLMRWKMSRADIDALFETERSKVLELARSVPVEAAARPVLIERVRGLEDSSRYWSVIMTMDHMRIVNTSILGVVRALGRGESLEGAVGIADLKPSIDAGLESIENFDRTCDLLVRAFAKIENLKTAKRYSHPWFGPLDAAGWHAMSAMHNGIHRRQIERILDGL